MLNKTKNIILTTAFVLTEIVLLILILTLKGSNTINIICYSSVVVAFLYALLNIKKDKLNCIVVLAMLFTLISDIFLVLANPQRQDIAMTTFSITQLLYCAYIMLKTNNKKVNITNIIVRVTLIIIMQIVTVLVCKQNTNYLACISVFYYTNIILNLVFACIQIRQFYIFALGLLFFLICDTFVGFQCAIDVFITISHSSLLYKIVFYPFNFVWFFYLPSQTLIALNTNKQLFKKTY